MFCRQCGTQISDDAAYCGSCGAKVIRAETVDCISGTVEQGESGGDGKIEKQKSSAFWVWVIVIVSLGIIGLVIWLLFLFLRWLSSAFIPAVAVIAGGYILYHKVLAQAITEYFYDRASKEIHLPEGMTASSLLEALSGKFNYPYFKGVHYGADGECVIEGKYAMYPICFGENNITEISYIVSEYDKKKRTVLLEAVAVQDYLNKFFNPNLPVDVIKDMRKLKLAEGQRKAVAVVSAIASFLIMAAIVLDYVSPGGLQSMAVPGIEVRSAYLSQYSTKVTIEEAFEAYFNNCKWSKFDSEGYTYVAFTGTCRYFDEPADVRIVFKITGENFIVDSLDINGKTQNDWVLYGLLSSVYEDY